MKSGLPCLLLLGLLPFAVDAGRPAERERDFLSLQKNENAPSIEQKGILAHPTREAEGEAKALRALQTTLASAAVSYTYFSTHEASNYYTLTFTTGALADYASMSNGYIVFTIASGVDFTSQFTDNTAVYGSALDSTPSTSPMTSTTTSITIHYDFSTKTRMTQSTAYTIILKASSNTPTSPSLGTATITIEKDGNTAIETATGISVTVGGGSAFTSAALHMTTRVEDAVGRVLLALTVASDDRLSGGGSEDTSTGLSLEVRNVDDTKMTLYDKSMAALSGTSGSITCSDFFLELWSDAVIGFPFPSSCTVPAADSGKSVLMTFDARNGLKAAQKIELVFHASFKQGAEGVSPILARLLAADGTTVIQAAPTNTDTMVPPRAVIRQSVSGSLREPIISALELNDGSFASNDYVKFRVRGTSGNNVIPSTASFRLFAYPITGRGEDADSACTIPLQSGVPAPSCSLALVGRNHAAMTAALDISTPDINDCPGAADITTFDYSTDAGSYTTTDFCPVFQVGSFAYSTSGATQTTSSRSLVKSTASIVSYSKKYISETSNDVFISFVPEFSCRSDSSNCKITLGVPLFFLVGSSALTVPDSTDKSGLTSPTGMGTLAFASAATCSYANEGCQDVTISTTELTRGVGYGLKMTVDNPSFAASKNDPLNVWKIKVVGKTLQPVNVAGTSSDYTSPLNSASFDTTTVFPVMSPLTSASVALQSLTLGASSTAVIGFVTGQQVEASGIVKVTAPDGYAWANPCSISLVNAPLGIQPSRSLPSALSSATCAVSTASGASTVNVLSLTLPSDDTISAETFVVFQTSVTLPSSGFDSSGTINYFALATTESDGSGLDDNPRVSHVYTGLYSNSAMTYTLLNPFYGTALISLTNALAYSETSATTDVTVSFTSTVDLTHSSVIAPYGYLWDMPNGNADLTLGTGTPALEIQTATNTAGSTANELLLRTTATISAGSYTFTGKIRVPDQQPSQVVDSSSTFTNMDQWYLLMGDPSNAGSESSRTTAGVVTPSLQVRAIQSVTLGYANVGQSAENTVAVLFRTITDLSNGATIKITTPDSFVHTASASCGWQSVSGLLDSSTLLGVVELDPSTSGTSWACGTSGSAVTLTITVGSSQDLLAGTYVAGIALTNPGATIATNLWTVASWSDAGSTVADRQTQGTGVQVLPEMPFAEVVAEANLASDATVSKWDDRGGVANRIVLAFKLNNALADSSLMQIIAPQGYVFTLNCASNVIIDYPFGQNSDGSDARDSSAYDLVTASTVRSCTGSNNVAYVLFGAEITANSGGNPYAVALDVTNPNYVSVSPSTWAIATPSEAKAEITSPTLQLIKNMVIDTSSYTASASAFVSVRFEITNNVTATSLIRLIAPSSWSLSPTNSSCDYFTGVYNISALSTDPGIGTAQEAALDSSATLGTASCSRVTNPSSTVSTGEWQMKSYSSLGTAADANVIDSGQVCLVHGIRLWWGGDTVCSQGIEVAGINSVATSGQIEMAANSSTASNEVASFPTLLLGNREHFLALSVTLSNTPAHRDTLHIEFPIEYETAGSLNGTNTMGATSAGTCKYFYSVSTGLPEAACDARTATITFINPSNVDLNVVIQLLIELPNSKPVLDVVSVSHTREGYPNPLQFTSAQPYTIIPILQDTSISQFDPPSVATSQFTAFMASFRTVTAGAFRVEVSSSQDFDFGACVTDGAFVTNPDTTNACAGSGASAGANMTSELAANASAFINFRRLRNPTTAGNASISITTKDTSGTVLDHAPDVYAWMVEAFLQVTGGAVCGYDELRSFQPTLDIGLVGPAKDAGSVTNCSMTMPFFGYAGNELTVEVPSVSSSLSAGWQLKVRPPNDSFTFVVDSPFEPLSGFPSNPTTSTNSDRSELYVPIEAAVAAGTYMSWKMRLQNPAFNPPDDADNWLFAFMQGDASNSATEIAVSNDNFWESPKLEGLMSAFTITQTGDKRPGFLSRVRIEFTLLSFLGNLNLYLTLKAPTGYAFDAVDCLPPEGQVDATINGAADTGSPEWLQSCSAELTDLSKAVIGIGRNLEGGNTYAASFEVTNSPNLNSTEEFVLSTHMDGVLYEYVHKRAAPNFALERMEAAVRPSNRLWGPDAGEVTIGVRPTVAIPPSSRIIIDAPKYFTLFCDDELFWRGNLPGQSATSCLGAGETATIDLGSAADAAMTAGKVYIFGLRVTAPKESQITALGVDSNAYYLSGGLGYEANVWEIQILDQEASMLDRNYDTRGWVPTSRAVTLFEAAQLSTKPGIKTKVTTQFRIPSNSIKSGTSLALSFQSSSVTCTDTELLLSLSFSQAVTLTRFAFVAHVINPISLDAQPIDSTFHLSVNTTSATSTRRQLQSSTTSDSAEAWARASVVADDGGNPPGTFDSTSAEEKSAGHHSSGQPNFAFVLSLSVAVTAVCSGVFRTEERRGKEERGDRDARMRGIQESQTSSTFDSYTEPRKVKAQHSSPVKLYTQSKLDTQAGQEDVCKDSHQERKGDGPWWKKEGDAGA
uniref:PKD/REJ-like domain-containing protein n=1 Tax=Chromera velia CCMP2878 TaxID=1169474 RepID=A0A0G4IBX3_9ALVE|eukprot:Cvel_12968.t1-p1 / transcript=Cvel_12968.t1 / gene=Cvel_12968 / organism=Chromera_velia_CCMP2878 / gene_product=Serine-rich adhesin for platelets, putative / transcript_product=Serine-rich adhesin for platelets, putative / location=Cvel_scaffold868:25780-46744(+) / protein_length=2505 / sequence_SO=supercontig / SO=protein_coding / is_pseudo=false